MGAPTAAPGPRLKTVSIIARLNIGGPARHAVMLDGGLTRRGHDTLLVHGTPAPTEGNLEELAAEQGIRTTRVAELGPRIDPARDVRALAALTRLLFRERPDVVHTHTSKAGTLGRLAALAYNLTRRRASRCAVVHTFHGHVLSGYFGAVGNAMVRTTECLLARVTDRVVAISPSQKEDLVRRFRVVSDRKVAVIPLALDLTDLLALPPDSGEAKRTFGVPQDHVTIGFVGRFAPIKDLPTLLRAFALVTKASPRTTLLLVGEGECGDRLRTLAEVLGIGERVRFAGWCRDLTRVHGAIDVCAISSVNEGTPVALIEAMAAGRAVVATRVGGVPDVVRDGETGLLVSASDPERLSWAMLRVVGDASLRHRLGSAARMYVRHHFAADRVVEDLTTLYRAAVVQKRGGAALDA